MTDSQTTKSLVNCNENDVDDSEKSKVSYDEEEKNYNSNFKPALFIEEYGEFPQIIGKIR